MRRIAVAIIFIVIFAACVFTGQAVGQGTNQTNVAAVWKRFPIPPFPVVSVTVLSTTTTVAATGGRAQVMDDLVPSTTTTTQAGKAIYINTGTDYYHTVTGQCIKNAEHGDEWDWSAGDGGGGFQFEPDTWNTAASLAGLPVGLYGSADEQEQIEAFDAYVAANGYGAWTQYDGC